MTDITAIIKVFMEPGLKTDSPTQAPIRPGSLLNGRIIDILPSGLVQINFGKFRTQARIRFPVAKGDTLRFEVLETGDQIKLKIQDPPPAAVKAPVERFFKPEGLTLLRQRLEAVLQKTGTHGMDRGSADSPRLLLSRLINHLLPLSTGRQTDQLAPLIKATLANSGIFFEKRLETILLQIFKSPDRIDTGRAAAHPFVTNIFERDLKPNLLKLAALLAKTGDSREQPLASIRESSLKMLNQINAEQARLTRQAPTGSARRTGTYHRTDSQPSGLPGSKTSNLPPGTFKALQLQLVKSGLWSDPEIRAVARDLFKAGRLEVNYYTTPALKGTIDPVADRLNPDTQKVEIGTLQKTLAGLTQRTQAPQSKALGPFLKSFQAYVHENRFQLDPQTKAALLRLEDIVKPDRRKVSTAPGPGDRAKDLKQQLRALARFIDSRTAPTRSATQNPGKTRVPDRIAPKAAGKGLPQFALLVEPKAVALNEKLNRIDQTLVRILSDSAGQPDGKKMAQTARALRSLVGRYQLPADEAVNRALTTITAGNRSSKTLPASGLKSGSLAERLQPELVVLREFIGQQRTELKEALDTLKALIGRSTAESDPGDRPGPERARSADPMQVIAFSLPMEEGQKAARLKVFYPLKKRAATETGFRISLLLSMERMGPIRVDLFTHQKNLEIKFSTETEPARLHIGAHLKRLEDLLDGHFETVNLTAAVDAKTIAAFEYEDLELSGNQLVDLKA